MDAQKPRILPIGDAAIAEAARLVRAGHPVAVPTETVYGLGARVWDRAAVRRVFEAKNRPDGHPLIAHVLVADWAGLSAPITPLALAVTALTLRLRTLRTAA